jgi:hypothetical protein
MLQRDSNHIFKRNAATVQLLLFIVAISPPYPEARSSAGCHTFQRVEPEPPAEHASPFRKRPSAIVSIPGETQTAATLLRVCTISAANVPERVIYETRRSNSMASISGTSQARSA